MGVIGVPLLPIKHSTKDVGNNEATREAVNDWIRTSGAFDRIIDFDPVMADPADPLSLRSNLTCDHVHPNQAGYAAMANAIDLTIFEDTAGATPTSTVTHGADFNGHQHPNTTATDTEAPTSTATDTDTPTAGVTETEVPSTPGPPSVGGVASAPDLSVLPTSGSRERPPDARSQHRRGGG